jgi:protein ImuB
MAQVVCILVARYELLVACGSREELLRAPVALAPEPDREPLVGEVSGAAEAHGVRAGMRISEALARCPELRLITADPGGADSAWSEVAGVLERLGAGVESPRPGVAYFDAALLRRLYGGHIEGVLARARRALPLPARLGVAPTRFCAFAAARRARPGRRAKIVPAGAERAFLAPLPVALLRTRRDAAALPASQGTTDLPALLERLGIRTLGELAALPEGDVADRFGRVGLQARRLALGEDSPIAPRRAGERVVERIELPEAVSGLQLERILELLIDRLFVRPELRGRALRKLALSARFVEQGTWRREVTLREASSSRERLRLALAPKLGELPAPIDELGLEASSFGPPIGEQLSLRRPDERERRKRLREALRQTRAAAGDEALLRVLEIDPRSRVPERRAVLTPFPE